MEGSGLFACLQGDPVLGRLTPRPTGLNVEMQNKANFERFLDLQMLYYCLSLSLLMYHQTSSSYYFVTADIYAYCMTAYCIHHNTYDPGISPGSANQCILGDVYLRSNLSREHMCMHADIPVTMVQVQPFRNMLYIPVKA